MSRPPAAPVPATGRAWLLLGLAFAPYVLNDFAFLALADRPAWTVYAADYLSRAAGLAVLLLVPALARVTRPPEPGPLVWQWIAPAALAAILLHDAVYHFAGLPLDALLPELVLFRTPRLEPGVLYYFDATVGLLLVAVSEELVARRAACRLLEGLGWGAGNIVVLPALVFALQHWSMGAGAVLTAAAVNMVLMAAYLYARSLALVAIAHYVLALWVFV